MLTIKDLSEIEQRIDKSIEKKTSPKFRQIDNTLKLIQKDTRKILALFDFLDRKHQETRKRVDRMEDHLKLSV